MTNIKTLSSEEKMITLIACVIGIVFFLFYSKACQPIVELASSGADDDTEYVVSEVAVYNSGDIGEPLPEAPDSYTVISADLDAIEQDPVSMPMAASFAFSDKNDAELMATRYESEEPDASTEIVEETTVVIVEESIDREVFAKMDLERTVLLKQLKEARAKSDFLSVANSDQKLSLKEVEEARILEEKARLSESAKLKSKVEALTAEVDELKAALSSPPGAEEEPPMEDTGKEESAAEPKPEEKDAPAFVESEADLGKSKAALVVAIREMEELRGAGLKTQYGKLSDNLNANSLARIKFSSGKSSIRRNESGKINGLASKLGDKTELLIVGFADQSGSEQSNAELSSARAQAVAKMLGSKVGNSRVSAIYLGQTARFGSRPENRVVEIWEVKSDQ